MVITRHTHQPSYGIWPYSCAPILVPFGPQSKSQISTEPRHNLSTVVLLRASICNDDETVDGRPHDQAHATHSQRSCVLGSCTLPNSALQEPWCHLQA